MRWLVAIALLGGACDAGERRHAPPPTPTPPLPVPVTDDAAAPVVELLHAVHGATVTVSSQVKNPRILPAHLIDQDLSTAWNARTGELTGAWIEVHVPGAQITEVRMTAGHTVRGPRGEDYFTMNPRIAKVRLGSASGTGKVVALDVERRDLQALPYDGGEHVAIGFVELTPGSHRRWREVAVSELEVWGTLPAGSQPGAPPQPHVAVGKYPGDFCANVETLKAERIAERERDTAECLRGGDPDSEYVRQCLEDPVGLPACDDEALAVEGLAPPWTAPIVSREIFDDNFGPTTCRVRLETSTSIVLAVPRFEARSPVSCGVEATLQDIVKGGPRELVLRYPRSNAPGDEAIVVCAAAPLACTDAEPASTALSHLPVFR